MDQERDAYTQIKAIISDSSFLQEYEIEYVKILLIGKPTLHSNNPMLDNGLTAIIHCSRKLCKSMVEVMRINVHAWERILMGLFTASQLV